MGHIDRTRKAGSLSGSYAKYNGLSLAMLESGEVKSLRGIAERVKIDNSYVSRMVNLTNLAPDIVAAILDDSLPNDITLFAQVVDPPALWEEQRGRIEEATDGAAHAGTTGASNFG
ncbi:MAG: LacI family transcriptional regulator [Burkholderiales bacterium]